jgi:hypothetical protein
MEQLTYLSDHLPTFTFVYNKRYLGKAAHAYVCTYEVAENDFAIIFIRVRVSSTRKIRDLFHSIALWMLYTIDSRPMGDEFFLGEVECTYLIE